MLAVIAHQLLSRQSI